ncbi:expressed protein [Phakopsora pachyrhizi]|uniref:Expressed protein n=1 Tax=Phakopsora pachyrhizi TaxID=170000 RepID=A0AAV0BNY1_PHAPC|nr:expressed protein [Phakopsora pachyrhizi]
MLVNSFLYHSLLALFLFSAATVPIPRSLLWTPVRILFFTSVITTFSWKTSFSSIDLLIAFDCAPGLFKLA